jgi:hypothetical protein
LRELSHISAVAAHIAQLIAERAHEG